jgi:hypothetical protein
MSRLALTVQNIIAKYPSLPLTANSADFTWTAAGASFADGAGFALTGKEVLLARNPTGGALTVTISSVVDPYIRTGDITTYSIGAGEYAVFPPFPKAGWAQADGKLYLAASAATVEFAVLKLPD